MALPPQLAAVLGDNAAMVAAYSELAPGIPASTEVFEDMFRSLKTDIVSVVDSRNDKMKITARINHVYKKMEIVGLEAIVSCVTGLDDAGPPEHRYELRALAVTQEFPFTVAGTKAAIEYIRKETNYAKRSGFCSHCLALERPCIQ